MCFEWGGRFSRFVFWDLFFCTRPSASFTRPCLIFFFTCFTGGGFCGGVVSQVRVVSYVSPCVRMPFRDYEENNIIWAFHGLALNHGAVFLFQKYSGEVRCVHYGVKRPVWSGEVLMSSEFCGAVWRFIFSVLGGAVCILQRSHSAIGHGLLMFECHVAVERAP